MFKRNGSIGIIASVIVYASVSFIIGFIIAFHVAYSVLEGDDL